MKMYNIWNRTVQKHDYDSKFEEFTVVKSKWVACFPQVLLGRDLLVQIRWGAGYYILVKIHESGMPCVREVCTLVAVKGVGIDEELLDTF